MKTEYQEIGGGYKFAECRVGALLMAPNGQEVYFQAGDDTEAICDTVAALDEISEDVTDAKRAQIADMALGEYFA
jgi:hypothetical protein